MTAAAKKQEKPIVINKKNVYLFYGEDSYSSNQKLNLWKSEFIKKYGDTNLEVLDGNNIDVNELNTNIGTMPFLSDKRLIIIKDFLKMERVVDEENEKDNKDNPQKNVAENLENVPDSCVLIFLENTMPDKRKTLFKKLIKVGMAEYFPALSPEQAAKWIIDKAKAKNGKIGYGTAVYLAGYCGVDLWALSGELEKLILFSEDKEITKEMINVLTIPAISASIFKLTDFIAGKNVKESLRTLETLRESGEEPTLIFYMIVRHFRLLIQAQELIKKNEPPFSIASKLKQPPFVIKNLSTQSKNFSFAKLEEIYNNLLKIDIASKTGIIKSYQGDQKEFELALEKLIINCCK